MKKISILGSTGSIGTQTLEIARINSDIKVCGLAANNNINLLEKQVREFKPAVVAVYNENKAKELQTRIADTTTKVVSGMDGLIEISCLDEIEILVTGIVGMTGIKPTIAAINAGKDIALANKETMVCAGHIITPLAKEHHVSILPVDSEHSAIFQCLQGNECNPIDKILLTASGGPFRKYTKEQMKTVTLEDALKHPNWNMGPKVTIDSSTMANKGLEVIEASRLFGVSVDDVQVLIQPQSIIHSMVQFHDGAVMAQLGIPDMKLPIQYAIYYPERRFLPEKRLDFTEITDIYIQKPDFEIFHALKLAYEAGRKGGSLPTVFNAANEYAVDKFVNGRIQYLQIADIIEKAMNRHEFIENPDVDDILKIKEDSLKWDY